LEEASTHALVFVRRGWFGRTADGVHTVLDPALAYAQAPGDEQRYHHLHGQHDDCTYLVLTPDVVADLTGGAERLPPGPFRTTTGMHLAQRRLLTLARRGDVATLVEVAFALAANTISEPAHPPAVAPRTAAAGGRHRALLAAAREALAADPTTTLAALAGNLGVSPHHLSRLFHTGTGMTVSRHRRRLIARLALDRIADGERDLAGLAADLGLADQSHLNRVLRAEAGLTPTDLRRLLPGLPSDEEPDDQPASRTPSRSRTSSGRVSGRSQAKCRQT
jgi:AraC-like DNA-binding protein